MPASLLRHLVPSCLLMLAACPGWAAQGSDVLAGSDLAAIRAELDAMAAKRDTGLYELNIVPGRIERITLTDRLGQARTFHYLTFRLRNQVGSGVVPISAAKGYTEVLAEAAKQYEGTQVDTSAGAALVVPGVEGGDGVIIARQDAQVRTRTVSLSVLAYDDTGSRVALLGERGAADGAFAFRDLGHPVVSTVVEAVREAVEDRLGQRLLTTDELRARELPPYDASRHTEEGWAEGEVHGLVVFDRLDDAGRTYTLELRGLSNKFRVAWPAPKAAGELESYAEARFLRRTYVLRYRIAGDEFYRDRDRFEAVSAGWEWLPAYLRSDKRRAMAQARQVLAAGAGGAVDAATEQRFWSWYEQQRAAQQPRDGVPALPDLRAGAAR